MTVFIDYRWSIMVYETKFPRQHSSSTITDDYSDTEVTGSTCRTTPPVCLLWLPVFVLRVPVCLTPCSSTLLLRFTCRSAPGTFLSDSLSISTLSV